jgi:hypothetical protein
MTPSVSNGWQGLAAHPGAALRPAKGVHNMDALFGRLRPSNAQVQSGDPARALSPPLRVRRQRWRLIPRLAVRDLPPARCPIMHIFDLIRILRRGCRHEAGHGESVFVSVGITHQHPLPFHTLLTRWRQSHRRLGSGRHPARRRHAPVCGHSQGRCTWRAPFRPGRWFLGRAFRLRRPMRQPR